MKRLMYEYTVTKIEDLLDKNSLSQVMQAKSDEILGGILTNGRNVSVQKFSKETDEQAAFRVCLYYQKLKHPNLAQVLHCASSENGDYFVIYDVPYQGSVEELLYSVNPRQVMAELLAVLVHLQKNGLVVEHIIPSHMLLITRQPGQPPVLQLCCLGQTRTAPLVKVTRDLSRIPPELRGVSEYADSVYSAGAAGSYILSHSKMCFAPGTQMIAKTGHAYGLASSPGVLPGATVMPIRAPKIVKTTLSPRLADFEQAFLKSMISRMMAQPSRDRPSLAELHNMLQKDTV